MSPGSVFITSANLTETATERNIEIGLPARDRALAAFGNRTLRLADPQAASVLIGRGSRNLRRRRRASAQSTAG